MKYLSTLAVFIFSIVICFTQTDPNAPKNWESNSLNGKVKSVKWVTTNYEKKKTDTTISIITFNATGYVVRYEDLTGSSHSDPYLYEYFYNKNNEIIKMHDGKDTIIYDYDGSGCLIRKSTEKRYWAYTCDSLGRTISILYYEKNKLIQENYITYTIDGLVLTWQYKAKKKDFTTKYTYNKKGQVIRYDYSEGAARICKYNGQGDRIANYPDGHKDYGVTWQYVYDKQMNWIEKKMRDKWLNSFCL